MHFYKTLITTLFPFIVLNPEGGENPPENDKFVINYQDLQVITGAPSYLDSKVVIKT